MSSRTAADVAIFSAAIRTLDPDRPEATAVAFLDGTIVAVGSDAEVREVCDSSTEFIDGSDMAVVPGIVDGHIHPFLADHVVGADLTRCGTLAELHEALADERSRVGDGWVRGWGVDYGIFSDTGIDGRVWSRRRRQGARARHLHGLPHRARHAARPRAGRSHRPGAVRRGRRGRGV